jgi:hypothetical protein
VLRVGITFALVAAVMTSVNAQSESFHSVPLLAWKPLIGIHDIRQRTE